MKKVSILLFLFLMILPVFAQDDGIALNLSAGYMSYGGNFPLNNGYNFELATSILSIGLEHMRTNIGFEFSPYAFTGWSRSGDFEEDSVFTHNVMNLKIYWNVLTINDMLFLGPFGSVNYLYIDEKIIWDNVAFMVGGHFGVRLNLGKLYYNIVSAEIGYRNINGKNSYYIGGKVDLLALCLFYLYANSDDD